MRCCQCFSHDIAAHPHKSADSLIPFAASQPSVTTAAECAAVVHRDYEAANAAAYSNGREECWVVFEAAGVIYDPMAQTCVF
eukprot:COSAG06_NODE_17914_length_914_cov_1.636810_1_plen_82_part_00